MGSRSLPAPRPTLAFVVAALALVALGGCPDSEHADAGSADAGLEADAGDKSALVSLTLSPAAPELPIGASVRMSALGQYRDGTSEQLASEVAWSSDAPAIAAVGSQGADAARVTAHAPGSATIRAALQGVEASVVVTVLERAAVSLALSPASVSLAAGQELQLGATATYDDDTSGDVTSAVSWSTSAPAVAAVDEGGLLTTFAEGSAVITAALGALSATSALEVGPPVVVQVSAFNKHSAALLSNGGVLAFGHNRYGQTGVAPGQTPAACSNDNDCASVEVCDRNTGAVGLGVCSLPCAESVDCPAGDECDCLERDGETCTKGFCIDLVTSPAPVPGFTGVRRVVTTGFATFALLDGGRVLGVGRNTGGVFLGSGDDGGRSIETTPQPVMRRTPEGSLERFEGVVDLAGGLDYVLLLDEDGHVWSFGRGWLGQLGHGDTANWSAAVQITLPPPGGAGERVPLVADAIAAGSHHALALERGSGRVLGWGWNGAGQLGEGTKVGPVSDDPDTPEIDGQGFAEPQCALASVGSACLTGATFVDGGWAHTVALVGDDVVAWGWNGNGQLGDGSTTDRYRVGPAALSDVATLETGFSHVAAIKADGTLFLWGHNGFGQLADGTTTNRPSPAPLNLPGTLRQMEAGSDHMIALLDDGRVYVWGHNRWGELGLGDRAQRDTPTLHPSLPP